MAVARVTTWSAGQTLTATALNAEFDNLLTPINAILPGAYATGDLLYASSASQWAALGAGTNGFVLQMGASIPAWFNLFGTANTWTANQLFNNLIGNGTAGAIRLHNLTTAQRDALTPAAGQVVYNTTTSAMNVYTSAWTPFGSGGTQQFWMPASAMIPRITNGPSRGFTEQTTNKNTHESLDFDQTTQEFAQFSVGMPKSWNEGTVTFVPYWTAASGTGGVVFGLAGVATSDDDALDVAFGTAQTSTDTLIATGDCHVGSTSSAITIAGTPADNDYVTFQLNRTVADASDTLTADAKLLGILLIITTNADTDA